MKNSSKNKKSKWGENKKSREHRYGNFKECH